VVLKAIIQINSDALKRSGKDICRISIQTESRLVYPPANLDVCRANFGGNKRIFYLSGVKMLVLGANHNLSLLALGIVLDAPIRLQEEAVLRLNTD